MLRNKTIRASPEAYETTEFTEHSDLQVFTKINSKRKNPIINKDLFVWRLIFGSYIPIVSGNFASAEIGSFSFGRNRQN